MMVPFEWVIASVLLSVLLGFTVRSGRVFKAGLYQGYTLGYTRGSQQVLDALKLEVGNLIKERKDG
tara:strand:+ start:576 stop:773 length:198 start_codon:yes stop_codon:yes gene_type:complete